MAERRTGRRGWRRWTPAAGTAAGLWLCAAGPAAGSPAASESDLAPAVPAPEASRLPEPDARSWRSVWRTDGQAAIDARLSYPVPLADSEPGDLGDFATDVLRHGVRYERAMSMIDVPMQLGVRAPGSGSSIVTVEVRF